MARFGAQAHDIVDQAMAMFLGLMTGVLSFLRHFLARHLGVVLCSVHVIVHRSVSFVLTGAIGRQATCSTKCTAFTGIEPDMLSWRVAPISPYPGNLGKYPRAHDWHNFCVKCDHERPITAVRSRRSGGAGAAGRTASARWRLAARYCL